MFNIHSVLKKETRNVNVVVIAYLNSTLKIQMNLKDKTNLSCKVKDNILFRLKTLFTKFYNTV